MTDKGFRVTVEDLDTGDNQTMVVHAGDYMLIPFDPCHLHYTQRHASGTVQITLKGHAPQGKAEIVEPQPAPPRCICVRFKDTGGFRIADLCCPVHGVDGTDPGDGNWDAEVPETQDGDR